MWLTSLVFPNVLGSMCLLLRGGSFRVELLDHLLRVAAWRLILNRPVQTVEVVPQFMSRQRAGGEPVVVDGLLQQNVLLWLLKHGDGAVVARVLPLSGLRLFRLNPGWPNRILAIQVVDVELVLR